MNFNWLRIFHFHRWIYTPAIYLDKISEELAIPTEPSYRKCTICGKTQQEDKHCLGLNPPSYVSTWYTTEESK